jgi:hypothetical protein
MKKRRNRDGRERKKEREREDFLSPSLLLSSYHPQLCQKWVKFFILALLKSTLTLATLERAQTGEETAKKTRPSRGRTSRRAILWLEYVSDSRQETDVCDKKRHRGRVREEGGESRMLGK